MQFGGPVLVWALALVSNSAGDYRPGDSTPARSAKRYGWLKVRPLWMDIENSCFSRTCVSPYAVQLISMETSMNHTAMFNMDIDDPAPPVDMFFPTPPSRPLLLRGGASSIANFSVGLFGVDPTYRFPRHCHNMIQNSITFIFDGSGGRTRRRSWPSSSTSIISFGADCLNLTFQITLIPAPVEPDGRVASSDPSATARASSTGHTSFGIGAPVPMWILAVSAGLNAAFLFALVAVLCHIALSAKKRRSKRLRRQRSSAASSAATTTSTYVPACTTPVNRRGLPLPPPPLRPPPFAQDDQEPKYDVPWTERANGASQHYNKISFNTLPPRQKDGPFFSYYSATGQPVTACGETNCNEPARTLSPSTMSTLR